MTPDRRILAGGLILLLAGCGQGQPPQDRLAQIQQRGELRVLTRNSATTFYEDRHGPSGPEHDMIQSFARALRVDVRYRTAASVGEVLEAVRAGTVDLGAAGITRTPARSRHISFGPGYQQVTQQVVCHRDGPMPDSIAELSQYDLQVIADSSYEERLQGLRGRYPGLSWTRVRTAGSEHLLERVGTGEIDCTIADSNVVMVNRRYFPELEVAFSLGAPDQLAWALAGDSRRLSKALAAWFDAYRRSGALQRMQDRYYGHLNEFGYVDLHLYRQRIARRLPKFQALFQEAGRTTGLPWTLLAAQGYQESHWDPAAVSPTGVRGMMMLTRVTAGELGVEDRRDPRQSVMGGARYLRLLLERLPPEVTGRDRTWMALAAYNMGYGHLLDARALARARGLDPNRWLQLREVLPLLSQPGHYKDLPHGYARGEEARTYVRRIREFEDILSRSMLYAQNEVS